MSLISSRYGRLVIFLSGRLGTDQESAPRSEGAKISVRHGVGGMFAASGTIIMPNHPA